MNTKTYQGMTTEKAAFYTLGGLAKVDLTAIAYAGHPERGEHRGFAALHDKMDANMLLPFADENHEDDIEEYTEFCNAAQAIVSEHIVELYERWYS